MRYDDFEKIMSSYRLHRYKIAAGSDTRRALKLYRLNIKASQEMFAVISCFEIALRNKIDNHYSRIWGVNWLRDAAVPGGVLTNGRCGKTPELVNQTVINLGRGYSHPHLVARMDFGFWRYLFARHQYAAFNKTLLEIFPNKPRSTPTLRYDSTYIFTELEKINGIRNRIAHHEPICFMRGHAVCCTAYARQQYQAILTLFKWMDIDDRSLLYGLDHMDHILHKIDAQHTVMLNDYT